MCYRSAWLQSVGQVPNYEASMAKAFGSEWCQRMSNTALQVFGLEATALLGGGLSAAVQQGYLQSVSRTIAGGTSEIQRNIIATRGLGLPRS